MLKFTPVNVEFCIIRKGKQTHKHSFIHVLLMIFYIILPQLS